MVSTRDDGLQNARSAPVNEIIVSRAEMALRSYQYKNSKNLVNKIELGNLVGENPKKLYKGRFEQKIYTLKLY